VATEPKTPPTHRDTDDSGVDWRYMRRRYPDLKRTLGSLALILVPILFAAVVWFAANDRNNVILKIDHAQQTANEAKILATQALQAQATQAAVSSARWEDVQRTLSEIKDDIKTVKRNTQ
jgi:hypothetical protein